MEVHKIKIQGRFGNQLFQVAMMDYLNTYKKKRYILDARWSNPKDLALLLNLNIIKKSEILEKKNFHNNITKNLFINILIIVLTSPLNLKQTLRAFFRILRW